MISLLLDLVVSFHVLSSVTSWLQDVTCGMLWRECILFISLFWSVNELHVNTTAIILLLWAILYFLPVLYFLNKIITSILSVYLLIGFIQYLISVGIIVFNLSIVPLSFSFSYSLLDVRSFLFPFLVLAFYIGSLLLSFFILTVQENYEIETNF